MNARNFTLGVAVAVAASLAAADPGKGLAKGHEKQRERMAPIELDWKRDKARKTKDDGPAPTAPEIPDDIRVVIVKANRPRVAVPVRTAETLEARASRTAVELAGEAVRVWGFRQYWRAGFARGYDNAMNDPRVPAAERAEGFRYGRLDPRALLTGQQIAQQDASDQALRAAEDRVRSQFLDLSRMPQRDRDAAVRPSAPTWAGAVFAAVPVFEAVSTSMAVSSTVVLTRESRDACDGWQASRTYAVETGWKDADRAFSIWRDRQRPGSYWTRLSAADREKFRSVFVSEFAGELASLDLRPAYDGWRSGYADGWRYGAAVQGEWAYRQGYAEGFDTGVRDAAVITWPFAFTHAYNGSYDAAFARWSTTAQPAITAVRLVDATDDGVIEPGERIFVEADIVNYGGAAGTFDVHAFGETLEGGTGRAMTLKARSRGSLDRPLDARVAAGTPNRTDTVVTVSAGDDAFETRMHVTHPLVIDEGTAISADYLGGSVQVDVLVSNLSRRDLSAVVRAAPVGRGGPSLSDEPIRVAAGRSVRAQFVANDLRPLDLIGGRPQWRLTVDRERGTDDERVVGPQEVATDLASRDLLLYMVDLAREARPSRQDVAEARALFLDRMRADWDRARAADGNPYKRDVENGSATTALGDLARTLKNERRGFENDAVFDGLGDDIASFASELPGAHPLLRKWMKRLAKQI